MSKQVKLERYREQEVKLIDNNWLNFLKKLDSPPIKLSMTSLHTKQGILDKVKTVYLLTNIFKLSKK